MAGHEEMDINLSSEDEQDEAGAFGGEDTAGERGFHHRGGGGLGSTKEERREDALFGPSKFCGTPDYNESAASHSYGLESHCRSVLRDPVTGYRDYLINVRVRMNKGGPVVILQRTFLD